MPSLRFATVCSSNMNRSMEAHGILKKKGFTVESYGSGAHVKLPGVAIDKPNVYEFGTPYSTILDDLMNKDRSLYTSNGIVHMLERNKRIKLAPERYQLCDKEFDVVICMEERVYDQVVEDMMSREESSGQIVHLINVDIQDNHEEATIGAILVANLCKHLEKCADLDNEIDETLTEFEHDCNRAILHSVAFY